jgi:hypothetical protein
MSQATRAFAFKRAMYAVLAARAAQPGNGLSDVQVLYAWNGGAAQAVCVYLGGAVMDRPEDAEAVASPGQIAALEITTIGVHVRVRINPTPDDGIASSDALAERIGDEVASTLAANARLAEDMAIARIGGGVADYAPDEDAAATTLSLRVECQSIIT